MTIASDLTNSELTQFSVEVAAEGMLTASPDGRILSANQMACERLEYSLEELLEMNVADINPHYPVERWPERFEQLRRDRRVTLQTQHRSKSGKILDVIVSIAYFEFKETEYCCATIRDITAQKEAQHLLQLQSQILSRIASTAGNLDQTLTELCRLVEELVPQTMATIMLLDEDDGQLRFRAGPALTPDICSAFNPMAPAEDAGSCGAAAYLRRPVIVEDTRVSPHWGKLQDIVKLFNLLACWSVPIFDDHQNVIGTFAISHSRIASPTPFQFDLLQTATSLASIAIGRKRSEDQLQIAHNDLAHFGRISTMGELASSISHELNQPLASIVNDAYVLEILTKREFPEIDAIGDRAESIRQQTMRAAEIVRGMRSLATKTPPSRIRLSVEEIVGKSIRLLDPELRRSGTMLDRRCCPTKEFVKVDEVQIQQIIVNLVRNAIEAMNSVPRHQRTLTITTEVIDSDEVVIRVADTGPGINLANPESVFEAFNTTKEDGMGMGLTICRSIATAHGGRLSVEPREPNGTEFSLAIPRSNETECKHEKV